MIILIITVIILVDTIFDPNLDTSDGQCILWYSWNNKRKFIQFK